MINAAGSAGGPAMIELAHRRGFSVVACDTDPYCAAATLADEFFEDRSLSDEAYGSHLIDMARRYHARWIIPNSGILQLARAAEGLPDPRVLVSDPATVGMCEDKLALYDYLGSELAPRCWKVDSVEDLDEMIDSHPAGSLCIKPRRVEGSRGFYRLVEKLTADELWGDRTRVKIPAREFSARIRSLGRDASLQDAVVCEYLPGTEITVAGFFGEGREQRLLPFERVLPGCDGISTSNILHPSSIVDDVIRALRTRLPGLRYYVDIQVMLAADGGWRVIDVNPRISGLVACCPALPGDAETRIGGVPLLLPPPPSSPVRIRLYYASTLVPQPAVPGPLEALTSSP